MTRILVTGAAGFLGSHLVDAVLARGREVIGLDNFDPFYDSATKRRNLADALRHPRFRLVEGDILDTDLLAELIDPDTTVVHLAARPGVRPSLRDPVGYARVNVVGTLSVMEAMRRRGATRLVFASSSSVYGNATPSPFREDAAAAHPISPYAASKRSAELMLESLVPHAGIRVAALRFFTVIGPRQRPDLALQVFARHLVAGEPVTLFGDGSQARDYTYVDDIVSGIRAAVEWTSTAVPGVRYYNLGGSNPVPVLALLTTLAKALGVTPVVTWAPLPPGDVERTAADLSRAAAELGFRPLVPLEEGVARFAVWFQESYGHQR